MKELAKEVYGDSLHIWYQAEVLADHEYGKIFNRDADLRNRIAERLIQDVAENTDATSVFWYLGEELADIRLMARYLDGKLLVQVNVNDFDFALHTDKIEEWKAGLIETFSQIS